MVCGMTTARQVSESRFGRIRDDWFGVFMQWGPDSPIGANASVMPRERYSVDEREKLASRFEAVGRGDGLVPTFRLEHS
jgi:hypothetical protein